MNAKNLFKTTPMHTVYGWLEKAQDEKFPLVVVAYSKNNNEFFPTFCKNNEEMRMWTQHYNTNKNYGNETVVIETKYTKKLFETTLA